MDLQIIDIFNASTVDLMADLVRAKKDQDIEHD